MRAHDQSPSERAGIIVELATTTSAIREAQALRHQVYCTERQFLPATTGQYLEQDGFDAHARHVVIRRQSDGEVVATTRVVAARNSGRRGLPMQRYCCPSVFEGLPIGAMGEISRFAISKQARRTGALAGPELRLGLLRGILAVSDGMGLTHWCALMEPSLIRLLAATGVHFTPVGPQVECSGRRQPCVARIERAVAKGRRSHPHLYDSVTTMRLAS